LPGEGIDMGAGIAVVAITAQMVWPQAVDVDVK
jgi:hypothetical protein